MKKSIYILLLLLFLVTINGCYYKTLTSNESVVLADNETMSVIFLQNEYGYGESNRFITKIIDGNSITIREGKLYKGELNYKTIIEDRDCVLHNYINNVVFYSDQNGLQGATFDEELINDFSYNYLQNDFGELVYYYGTNKFVSLFDTDDEKIDSSIENKNIIYVSSILDSQTNNKISTVYKSDVIIYKINDEIYIKKANQTKIIDENTGSETINNSSINTYLTSISNIKEALVIDYFGVSKTIILTYDNTIYSIDNNTLEIKTLKKFNNISTFNKVENYFYIVENNAIYVYNHLLKEIKKVEFDEKILGSLWFKEVDISYIKIALLDKNNHIIFDRVDLNN